MKENGEVILFCKGPDKYNMKRIMSNVDFHMEFDLLWSDELLEYGIVGATQSGIIEEEYVDQMLCAVEKSPDLHIVSFKRGRYGYNYYKPGSNYYYLARGDADLNIEISPDAEVKFKYTQEIIDGMNSSIREIIEEEMKKNPSSDAERYLRIKFVR